MSPDDCTPLTEKGHGTSKDVGKIECGKTFCRPSCEEDALYGLRGCKNGPTPFPGRISYKQLNQASSIFIS